MSLEKRIEKLEGVCQPQRQLRPTFVVLDANGEPPNEYYAEVLRLNREAEARGEDVCLFEFCLPAGFTPSPGGLFSGNSDQANSQKN